MRRGEHALLISGGKPPEKRKNFGIRKLASVQHLGAIADFTLAGKENENIAARIHFIDERHAARHEIGQLLVFAGFNPAVFNRKETPFDLLDGSSAEKRRQTLRFQSCGRDDQLQIRTLREKKFEVAEQKIDIQRTFVNLVENHAVVLVKHGVVARLRKQNAVGHEFDNRPVGGAVVKSDFVSDLISEFRSEFSRDAAGKRRGRDPARLRASDTAKPSASGRKRDLRELRRFAGTR